jgi:hypothetical protein
LVGNKAGDLFQSIWSCYRKVFRQGLVINTHIVDFAFEVPPSPAVA